MLGPNAIERLHERRELMKFTVVGAITWLVDTGVVYAFTLTARASGVLIATIVSDILNREWSFNT
ncbi:hypothetical protein AB0L63_20405 [Nocardia sp. NPDC051990]|uniref:hypothetical protein n=1 Tax=Nocardia sp. NPDC051990 TaxID=3155285 RepID=UPI00341CDDD5